MHRPVIERFPNGQDISGQQSQDACRGVSHGHFRFPMANSGSRPLNFIPTRTRIPCHVGYVVYDVVEGRLY